MIRQPRVVVAVLVLVASFGLFARGQSKPGEGSKRLGVSATAKSPDKTAKGQPASGEATDEQAIIASAAAFEKSYNGHDAKGLAALFAAKAEITDEAGQLVQGREAIEAEFQKQFEAHPQCRIAVEVSTVRLLSQNIALEDGLVRSRATSEEPEAVSSYTCIHVRVDGQWLLASVTDTPVQTRVTPHEHLQELAWLLGDWVNENPGSTVNSRCEWDESGNFLMNHFAVQFAGKLAMHGTTRIGWDAVAKQYRSWSFDSEGGFAEGLWISSGNEWILKMSGNTAEGETCSSTNVYRLLDKDTITFRSYDRIIDGNLTDEVSEIVIKRRAPAPAE